MIDTHSHIDMLDNPSASIQESIEAGIEYIIVPSSSPDNFKNVIELTSYDLIYAALGVHPEDVSKFNKNTPKDIYNLIKQNNKVIAIGEIGLDYYWDKTTKEKQKDIFKIQLELAKSLDLPVLVHDREAHNDTYEILKSFEMKKVIMHCFSGSVDFAKQCIKECLIIGVGGVVILKKKKKLKEAVLEVPLENIVLETDAPYLTPHPFRGEENSPKYLKFILREIANIKDLTSDHVEKQTTKNAKEFFNLK